MTSSPKRKINSLQDLLRTLSNAGRQDSPEVRLGDIMEVIGYRSFGPLLLVNGLLTLSPLGDIPGMPSLMAVLLLTVTAQILMKRGSLWLPSWLLEPSVSRSRFQRSLTWLKKPARFVDHGLKPRLRGLTDRTARYVIAGLCLLIALAMPPMELVPFTATTAGIALSCFGLALTLDDGLMVLIAVGFIAATVALALYLWA